MRSARLLALATMIIVGPGAFGEDSGQYVDVEAMERAGKEVEHHLAHETDPAAFVQYRTLALAFASTADYAKPFADVELYATIRRPDGAEHKVYGFYDGEGVWKVRYCPLIAGEYNYTTVCSNTDDTGLHGKKGSFAVQPVPAGETNPLYLHGGFLKASANGRYFTYHDGTPFYWLGDTWWFVPTEDVPYDASSTDRFKSMYKLIVRLREKQQYSVVHCAFLGSKPEFSTDQMHDKEIFLKPSAWTNKVLGFWKRADRYFLYANESGLILSIGLLWTWDLEQLGWKAEDVTDAFKYVQARYGSYNILWYVVAEYNAVSPEITQEHLKVAAKVREFDPYASRPMTIMPWPPYLSGKEAWDEPWFDFILIQGGHFREPGQVLPRNHHWEAYFKSGRTLPMVVGEQNFERIYDKENDDGDVRAAAYRAMFCGACGYTYGATGLWYPNKNVEHKVQWHWGNNAWYNAIDYPGAKQMTLMRNLLETFEWWLLAPDPKAVDDEDYAVESNTPVVCRQGDDLFLVYFPPQLDKTAPVHMRGPKPDAAYEARFFDVRTGAYQSAKAGAFTGDTLMLPDRPSNSDWVLILKNGAVAGAP